MFNPWLENGRFFIKLKPLNIWIKMIFLSYYSSESCQISDYTLMWFDRLYFLTSVLKFSAFKTSLKSRFLLQQFAMFLLSFSVWWFKKEFNLLPDVLNTGFTIIEIGLFYFYGGSFSYLSTHWCYQHLTLIIFRVTSNKHCAFTISYVLFGNLNLFASYAILMRPKKAETAVYEI